MTDSNDEPCTYLSISEGKFRVINGGLPIGTDKDTLDEALVAAQRMGVIIAERYWNGDTGKWEPMSEVRRYTVLDFGAVVAGLSNEPATNAGLMRLVPDKPLSSLKVGERTTGRRTGEVYEIERIR